VREWEARGGAPRDTVDRMMAGLATSIRSMVGRCRIAAELTPAEPAP
jgi:hypothetical protein